MTDTAFAAPAVLASAAGPVVAWERGPTYAAGSGQGGADAGGGDGGGGGLAALVAAADPAVVGAALAGLPAPRLARVVTAAVDGLGDSDDAAGVAAAAAGSLDEQAARGLCGVVLATLGEGGQLGVAADAVAALGNQALTPGGLPDAQLHASWRALHRLERRVVAEKYRRVREITQRGSCVTEGARTTVDLLVRHGLTRAEAREQVATATALGELPKTAQALAAGTIGAGQAAEAGKALHDATQATTDLPAGDGTGQSATGDGVAGVAGDGDGGGVTGGDGDTRRGAAAGEQDAARAAAARAAAARAAIDDAVAHAGEDADRRVVRERLERQAATRSHNRLADKERRAFRHRYGRKFRDGDGFTVQFHGPAAAVATIWTLVDALSRHHTGEDPRTPDQRRFDALRHVADRYLRQGRLPDIAGHPAQVLLVTTHHAAHDTNDAAPPTIDGYGPVSSETARMICCDAEIAVVVTRSDGQPLSVGRTRYQPNRAQRRAVTARDRVCIGCGQDALRCEIHHIRWFRHGGTTDIDNLVLVCWSCHTHIHHHGWTVWRDTHGYHAGPHGPPPNDPRHLPNGRPPDAPPPDGPPADGPPADGPPPDGPTSGRPPDGRSAAGQTASPSGAGSPGGTTPVTNGRAEPSLWDTGGEPGPAPPVGQPP